jgi:hypothetical protein
MSTFLSSYQLISAGNLLRAFIEEQVSLHKESAFLKEIVYVSRYSSTVRQELLLFLERSKADFIPGEFTYN